MGAMASRKRFLRTFRQCHRSVDRDLQALEPKQPLSDKISIVNSLRGLILFRS
jgi:hypothetical protein